VSEVSKNVSWSELHVAHPYVLVVKSSKLPQSPVDVLSDVHRHPSIVSNDGGLVIPHVCDNATQRRVCADNIGRCNNLA
jgi:hypothetical protein